MFKNLLPPKDPIFENGNHITCFTIKNNPNAGYARGFIKFSHYDVDQKLNICFVELYAYQNAQGDWRNYEPALKIFRTEKELTLV